MRKPYLPNASVSESFSKKERPAYITEEAWKAILRGEGKREYGTKGDFSVNSIFTINEYEYNGSDGFACSGTKDWLSVFKLTGGCNHLEVFKRSGTEKSSDYDSLPDWRILDLPNDYREAIAMINSLYIGKTIRVVAKSPQLTQYDTSYYLFAVE